MGHLHDARFWHVADRKLGRDGHLLLVCKVDDCYQVSVLTEGIKHYAGVFSGLAALTQFELARDVYAVVINGQVHKMIVSLFQHRSVVFAKLPEAFWEYVQTFLVC